MHGELAISLAVFGGVVLTGVSILAVFWRGEVRAQHRRNERRQRAREWRVEREEYFREELNTLNLVGFVRKYREHVTEVHQDSCGTLRQIRFFRHMDPDSFYDNERYEINFRFVVVKGSEGQMHFICVPQFVETALEAVAWTFGLLPEEYNPATQT